MTGVPDIRELAQRAELEFQTRPHPHRSSDWRWGLVCGTVCLAVVAIVSMTGNHRFYSAGELSDSHAFIANDCRACHNTWKPLGRLADLDADPDSVANSSITNQACLKCHATSEHHSNQIPAHDDLSCAACHREHRGRKFLAKVTDQQCIKCHENLKTTEDSSTKFASRVTAFDAAHGHPEFHLWRRLASSSLNHLDSNLTSQKELDFLAKQDHPLKTEPIRDVLKPLGPNEMGIKESNSGLRDRTELRFNHAVHFRSEHMLDKNGNPENLARNCQQCHELDVAGRSMLPVNFEAHCSRCHPLYFDNENFPDLELPHERLALVRGFLTDKYTFAAVNSEPLQEHQPPRPLPGQTARSVMNEAQARKVQGQISKAEKGALENMKSLTSEQMKELEPQFAQRDITAVARTLQLHGRCKLCHAIQEREVGGLADIVPPDQPGRWFAHARFDHAAHRTFDCLQCHSDVPASRPERDSARSQSAADVLLPRIADCQTCHVSSASHPRVVKQGSTHPTFTVISNCVMCHVYHRRDKPAGNSPAGNQSEIE